MLLLKYNTVARILKIRLTGPIASSRLSPEFWSLDGGATVVWARSFRALAVAATCVVMVGGCSGIPKEAEKDPTTVLLERAQARWDAVIRSDFKTAYEYLSPGSRQVHSYDSFAGRMNPGFWKEAKVKRAECSQPDVCEVVADITYVFQGSRIATLLRENWTRSDGKWWYVLK